MRFDHLTRSHEWTVHLGREEDPRFLRKEDIFVHHLRRF